MLNYTKNQNIYVVCPASLKSGGPELLHQLVYSLNRQGARAYITYVDIDQGQNVTAPEFKKYITGYKKLSDIDDSDESIIVLPETRISLLSSFKRARMCIWWLSVDNYEDVYLPTHIVKKFGAKGILGYYLHRRWRFSLSQLGSPRIFHLAQSQYAIDFLRDSGISNVYYLSDYINREYSSLTVQSGKRRDIVLYNPKKGFNFTRKLIERDSSLEWKPLVGMTNLQVKNSLLTSKVYVDFGNHPGKDRFPREAAILGCCVITDKKGSAANDVDVPIPSKYKFVDSDDEADSILREIHDCIDNFEYRTKDFDLYRDEISSEYDRFNHDVHSIFMG